MDKQTLVSIVNEEFEGALGGPTGEISFERAKAWDRYLSKPLGNEVDGQSQVVTSDVEDCIDGQLPSILRIFTSADNLVSFDPVGPEDIEAAEQESDYVNYVFFKQNPAFLILYNWTFDALLQKNGIVKCWWDTRETITTETYEGLTDNEYFDLLSDDELEVVEQSERSDTDPTTGEPQTLHDVVFRRVKKFGRVTVENVPPEEYRISRDARSLDPSTARMVGHEREVTRSELLEMGFSPKWVESLPAQGDQVVSPEDQARRDKTEERNDESMDRSQDRILLREAYIRVDYDGDGRAELRQVFTANNQIAKWKDGEDANQPVDRQPFHVICPKPLPHKHFGRSTADRVIDVEEVNTTLLRQTLDNLYHSNHPRPTVWEHAMGDNTMDDLLSVRVGSPIRVVRPVNESIGQYAVPFTAQSSFAMLEYFDRVKRTRTGIHDDGEGLSPDALKNIQQSVMAEANEMSRMKIELIARIFAETGIKSLFLHIHELLLKYQNKKQIVRLRNRFVEVNPQEWRTRSDMTVNIGLGIGTRDRNLIHLNAIWEKQMQMVQAGGLGLTVTPRNIYMTAAEMVKNARLQNPDFYFTDPGDQQAPPPNQEQIELQKQQQALVQRQQQLDAEEQQIAMQRLRLQAVDQQRKHEVAVGELQRKIERDHDDFAAKIEELKNELLEIQQKYSTTATTPSR